MKIEKLWLSQIPADKQFDGITVMVDANAASSNMSVLLSKKPARLIVVNEESLPDARKRYPDSILVGESLSLDIKEFSASNHISSIDKVQAKGRNILWMSINGSRVFERMCKNPDQLVLAGAFNNCQALVNFLGQRNENVLLVMAGHIGEVVLEDQVCADIIEKRLKSLLFDWQSQKAQVAKELMKYFDQQPIIADDIPLLLSLDQFNIVPRCFKNSAGFLEVEDILKASA